MNQLEQLKTITKVVADTGDIDAIKRYQPVDATTNPSLILKAATLPQYNALLTKALEYARYQSDNKRVQAAHACDYLAVGIGKEIQGVVPGFISTEVDARLSFNAEATIGKARDLLDLYKQAGADTSRVLIKIASTWEGIKAAEILEKEGIRCNLTLLFSLAQAQACAEAGVYLISPFVGRILDWYKKSTGTSHYAPAEDPGVISVSEIYNYYKEHDYKTVVMGASFRNIDEIRQLAGCDCLTISPDLLDELEQCQESLEQKLFAHQGMGKTSKAVLNEAEFRWAMNENPLATEKLSEGIRNFAIDQKKLETLITQML
ncbi:transaldolase [Endozoicomonas montiporae]|uniref:Transaldolase n=2 Tax=Endozoicomonas montiporae TaxID=1027273 RepID=A0A081MZ67_9GAMM|nr:transaldolase [Endozoicomonas montiporae]AMO54962.1 transaldolase B [Endozoicomonas montiporae CL-33]KEQ11490.1 transaldolase [Endozoicomonas montiporae]